MNTTSQLTTQHTSTNDDVIVTSKKFRDEIYKPNDRMPGGIEILHEDNPSDPINVGGVAVVVNNDAAGTMGPSSRKHNFFGIETDSIDEESTYPPVQ